jgi:hypothetical protein
MAKLPSLRPVQPAALPLPVPSIWYRYALTADWADPDRAARLHRRALCIERLEKTLRDRMAALDASGSEADWPEFLQLEQALRDLRDLSAAPWCPLEK